MKYEKYIQPTKVDSPAVGNLFQARDLKKRIWRKLKAIRSEIKSHGDLGAGHLFIQRLRTEGDHGEALRMEREALQAIERRANELGMTTIRERG